MRKFTLVKDSKKKVFAQSGQVDGCKNFTFADASSFYQQRLQRNWDATGATAESLLAEIRQAGPLIMTGYFGPQNYPEGAEIRKDNNQVGGQPVIGFKKDTHELKKCEMMLVVGVYLANPPAIPQAMVILAPLIAEKANDASKQPVYCMSFDTFCHAYRPMSKMTVDRNALAAVRQQINANKELQALEQEFLDGNLIQTSPDEAVVAEAQPETEQPPESAQPGCVIC